jgi:4-hydroxy-3-methylbut-2-enyl diphosphate reductase
MGRRRSERAALRLGPTPVLVAGVAGGLANDLGVGDVVVASEIRAPDGVRVCPAAPTLVDDLRGLGLTVHCGPISSWPRLAAGAGRRHLAAAGSLAVDMESAWLAPGDGIPFAVVRAISDTAATPASAIVRNGLAALRALRRAVPALDAWAGSVATEVT